MKTVYIVGGAAGLAFLGLWAYVYSNKRAPKRSLVAATRGPSTQAGILARVREGAAAIIGRTTLNRDVYRPQDQDFRGVFEPKEPAPPQIVIPGYNPLGQMADYGKDGTQASGGSPGTLGVVDPAMRFRNG